MNGLELQSELRFERLTGHIGAVVHGIGLDESRPPVARQLRHALHEHGVLFFHFDDVVSAEEFSAFGQLFGEAEREYGFSMRSGKEPFLDSDTLPMKEVRINRFHTDGTALDRPPQAAMLTPFELPEVGGDTIWASMYAAWEDLSSHYQRLLENVEVLHSTFLLPWLNETASAVHPAVIRDAVTGRKMLFVNPNYSERIIGMSETESDNLLQMLYNHINTPEYHVRLRWRLGTIAVWEERVTQHRGVADFNGPRKLRRITFTGDRPSA